MQMSFFKVKNPNLRCAAIIDVGGGSVGIAIVTSESDTNTLKVIWSHREHMLIKEEPNEADFLREINTTVINALLELGNSGAKTLHEYDKSIKIQSILITLSAPWSYTVTKSVHYEDEVPFTVTDALITQLTQSAENETHAILAQTSKRVELGVRVITSKTVDVTLNGYSISNPTGKKCTTIDLAHISIAAQEKILQVIEDSCQKILPNVPTTQHSFMYLYYQVLKHLHPDTNEVCLIDVTNQATEIGIVRDNILRNTTYAPIGMYSLARSIAKACDIPKEEAFSILKTGTAIEETYTKSQVTAINTICTEYIHALAQLFTQTEDKIMVPKTFFLHTSTDTEQFFSLKIKEACAVASIENITVLLCTSELLEDTTMDDTALALSTYYYHHAHMYT